MDDLLALDIQERATEFAATLTTSNEEHPYRWRWPLGTVMFPQARCPFCNEVMTSNRIWRIHHNTAGKCFEFRDGKISAENPMHPHISNGIICLGSAVDPIAALFANGLQPRDCFDFRFRGLESRGLWYEWMFDYFDHACSTSSFYTCAVCQKQRPNSRKKTTSENQSICFGCYAEKYSTCSGCSKCVLKGALIRKMCRPCALSRGNFATCEKCELSVHNTNRVIHESKNYHKICVPGVNAAALSGEVPVDEILVRNTHDRRKYCACGCGCRPYTGGCGCGCWECYCDE